MPTYHPKRYFCHDEGHIHSNSLPESYILIYPPDQSSPGALDPPLPTHERYQNSNANFGFRGSFQMRQNVCHPHRPASTLSIDLGDWIRLYMGGIPDEAKTAFLWLSYGFSLYGGQLSMCFLSVRWIRLFAFHSPALIMVAAVR